MLTAIEGYFEKGRIFLKEDAPVTSKTRVIVTFLAENENGKQYRHEKRILGQLNGKIIVPDDFNEELDDLKEYM